MHMADGLKKAVALGAASAALAVGALFGAAGSASAAPMPDRPHHHHCFWVKGHWSKEWRPGHAEGHHHWRHGHWIWVWHPGHRECHKH